MGVLRPKLLELNAQDIVVKLPLKRRSRNHLHSMYFGALAVGADIAGGLHAFYHANSKHVKASIAFKSFHADFLKRPESDVFFVSNQGKVVAGMLNESLNTGQRVNKQIPVDALINYPQNSEIVAKFTLELSVKVLGKTND